MSKVLKIWHKRKHADYEVTERPTNAPVSDVEYIRDYGGFWSGDAFIPWRSISYIQACEREESKP